MNECRARCLSLFSVDLNQLPLWILLSQTKFYPPSHINSRKIIATHRRRDIFWALRHRLFDNDNWWIVVKLSYK